MCCLILRLALIAWRNDRGQLPDHLEDLVGAYLDHLPLDPLTGKPFILVKTLDDARRLLPEATTLKKPELTELPGGPALFTPSRVMNASLRLDRPDGRGEVWFEFANQDATKIDRGALIPLAPTK